MTCMTKAFRTQNMYMNGSVLRTNPKLMQENQPTSKQQIYNQPRCVRVMVAIHNFCCFPQKMIHRQGELTAQPICKLYSTEAHGHKRTMRADSQSFSHISSQLADTHAQGSQRPTAISARHVTPFASKHDRA